MTWKYNGQNEKKTCRDRKQKAPYVTCVHSDLPKINKAIIEFDDGFRLKDPKNQIKTEYEPQEDSTSGYQLPCKGDSGAPHWVVNDDNEAVLVGIAHSGGDDLCGYFAHMQTTIDSDIFDFIWKYGVHID